MMAVPTGLTFRPFVGDTLAHCGPTPMNVFVLTIEQNELVFTAEHDIDQVRNFGLVNGAMIELHITVASLPRPSITVRYNGGTWTLQM